jgi:endonuclease YncB( thermonuclease family)
MSALFLRARLRIFLLPLLFFFSSCSESPESARVVRIADGDTITILYADNTQEKIRLYGIDCPERTQPFGRKARQFTSSLVFGKQVTIRSVDRDRYGRNVAWIYIGEINLNAELVRAGYAWHYRKHSNDPMLQRLENEARKAGRGLWRDSDPVPPWKYRNGKRN